MASASCAARCRGRAVHGDQDTRSTSRLMRCSSFGHTSPPISNTGEDVSADAAVFVRAVSRATVSCVEPTIPQLLMEQQQGLELHMLHDDAQLLVAAEYLAPLPAAAVHKETAACLGSLPGFHKLLARRPALLDAYLRSLGRWVAGGLPHGAAAWQVLSRVPRAVLVPLAEQRLRHQEPRVAAGAAAALVL